MIGTSHVIESIVMFVCMCVCVCMHYVMIQNQISRNIIKLKQLKHTPTAKTLKQLKQHHS